MPRSSQSRLLLMSRRRRSKSLLRYTGFCVSYPRPSTLCQGSWSIKSGSGAVLVIRKPVFVRYPFRYSTIYGTDYPAPQKTIPREFDVNMLINHRDLRDQFIVTGVTTCPSYAFYLGSKGTLAPVVLPPPLTNSQRKNQYRLLSVDRLPAGEHRHRREFP